VVASTLYVIDMSQCQSPTCHCKIPLQGCLALSQCQSPTCHYKRMSCSLTLLDGGPAPEPPTARRWRGDALHHTKEEEEAHQIRDPSVPWQRVGGETTPSCTGGGAALRGPPHVGGGRRRVVPSRLGGGGSPDQAVSASKVRRFRGGHYGTQVMQ
jgi:hypothetical protein